MPEELSKVALSDAVRALAAGLEGSTEDLQAVAVDDQLGPTALDHRVAPALALRFHQQGLSGPTVEACKRPLRSTAMLQMLLAEELQRLGDHLGRADIPWAPLKGMDLAFRLYDQPEERPTSDLDVLISLKHLDSARDVLTQAGWRSVMPHPREERFLLEEGYNWKAEGPRGTALELHFRLWGSVPAGLGAAVLEQAESAVDLGSTARRLNDVDTYLLAAAHLWVTPAPRPLLYWWELAKIARQAEARFAEKVATEVERWELELPIALAAAASAQLFDEDINAEIAQRLLPRLRPLEKRAFRRCERLSPEILPLSTLVLARLLSRRPSRMGWKTLPRRLWGHPGVVEHHAPRGPWPLRRTWHIAKSLGIGALTARIEKRLER